MHLYQRRNQCFDDGFWKPYLTANDEGYVSRLYTLFDQRKSPSGPIVVIVLFRPLMSRKRNKLIRTQVRPIYVLFQGHIKSSVR